MKRLILRVIAVLAVVATAVVAFAVATSPTPAQAASSKIVWVDVSTSKKWPTSKAIRIVDKYTGTTMKLGKCHTGAKCIVIRESGKLPRSWGAATYPGAKTKLLLNKNRRSVSYAQRLHILVHELGHANGIYTHTRTCVSVMYSNVRCPSGRLAPLTFTAAERRTLRAN